MDDLSYLRKETLVRKMREIHTDIIVETVRDMCISANLNLALDMEQAIRRAAETEDGKLGKQILGQLIENMDIAKEDGIPI